MNRFLFPLIAAGLIVLPCVTMGSGTYNARIPRGPAKGLDGKGSKIDRERYDLGQKVFNGQSARAEGNAAAQLPRLEALQKRLPNDGIYFEKRKAKKKNLPSLAGKISDFQLDALEYYIQTRYPAAK